MLPAPFRTLLGERFTVTVIPGDGCVALYSQENWNGVRHRLETAPRSQKRREFERFLSDYTMEEADCDAQGRLQLSQTQREFAGLERELATVKQSSRVEIWARERFDGARMSVDEARGYDDEFGIL